MACGVLLAGTPARAGSSWPISSAAGSAAQATALSPSAPSTVTAACSSTGRSVVISWSASPHASAYTVYQSQTGGAYTVIAKTPSTSWTTGRLTNHGSYTFEVSTLVGTAWTSKLSSPSTTRSMLGSRCS